MSNGRPRRAQGGESGNQHGGAGSDRWLLTYADLITLLMVFFIVLYAMSQVDKVKYARLAAYLAAAFGGQPVVIDASGFGNGFAPIPPGDTWESALAVDVLQALGERLQADLVSDGRFTVRIAPRGLVISLIGSAAFDSGEAEIRSEFLPLLDAVAERLKVLSNDISVEGFTDTDPIQTDKYPSNWYLSTARANRVRDYLERRGVPRGRMMVVGYGETRPAWSNATPDGKARNRRVDVVILRDRQLVDVGQEITPAAK